MKTHLIAALAALFATSTAAQEAVMTPAVGSSAVEASESMEPADPVTVWEADPKAIFDATDVDIDAFKWRARPVIVFADSPLDPAFQTQMEYLSDGIEDAIERDIVVITDTNPDTLSDLRRQLRPRGFMMVLVGKDGGVKLRKPFPWNMREIGRTIDKMPMRQREIHERRGTG